MGGPTHGTAQLQVSHFGSKGSQNPGSSVQKHVEIQENNFSELGGLQECNDSQSDNTNLVLVNQAEMFLPNEHIEDIFDKEDE